MTFKRFFIRSLLLSLVLTAAFALFNMYMDEFGLFRNVKGREIRIFTAEMTSKYLLSFRYIPANFNALMIGPSLSDQLDTRKIHGYKMYNLSLLAGNVRELKLPVLNVLEHGKVDLMIVCVHPFLTRDNVLRDKRVTPESYWSALGSTFIFKLYADKLKRFMTAKIDNFIDSAAGYSIPIQKVPSVDAAINDFAAKIIADGHQVNPLDQTALSDLNEILEEARRRGVRIVAYYHPDPLKVFAAYTESYRQYQQKIKFLFREGDLVYDFNTPQYDGFRQDNTNYIDHAHLSVKGADFVVNELNRLLEQNQICNK